MRPADSSMTMLVLAWLWAGIPFACGVAVTIQNALKLFK